MNHLWKAFHIFYGRWWTVKNLQERLEISRSTAYRLAKRWYMQGFSEPDDLIRGTYRFNVIVSPDGTRALHQCTPFEE